MEKLERRKLLAAHFINVQIVQVCDDAGAICAPLGPDDFDLARPNAYAYEQAVNEIWAQAEIEVDFEYVRWNNSAALDLTAAERELLFALGGQWNVGAPPPGPIDGVQFFFLRTHEAFAPAPGANQAQVSGLTELGIMQPVFSTNGRGIIGNEGPTFDNLSGVLPHELGHALGLRHIGEPAGGNVNDPRVSLANSTPNLMWAGGQGPMFDSSQTLTQNFDLTPAQIQAVIANGTSTSFDPDGNGQGPLKTIVSENVPNVTVSSDSQSVGEASGSLSFDVVLSATSNRDVTVPLTVGGSASEGDDFTLSTTSVVIDAGDISATVSITVRNDDQEEQNETIIVTLDDPTGANLGTAIVHTATVEDDDAAPDTTPPMIVVPTGISVEGDTLGGANRANLAISNFLQSASATDDVDTSVTVTGDGPSVFPVGETTVTFSATDSAGNNAAATAVVTVTDTTNPVLTVPSDVSVTTSDPQGLGATSSRVAAFLSEASATDVVDESVDITHDAPAILPIGANTITFTATDDGGNATTSTAVVTVREANLTSSVLDVSGNGNVNPFQDGILIVRFMLGQPDPNLEDTRLLPSDAVRTSGTEIRAHLEAAGDTLDVNGDGNVNAFQDGILIVRYLLGQPDANLEDSRLITATSTRNTGAAIRAYLDTLIPAGGESEFFPDFELGQGEGEAEAVIRTMNNPVDVNGDGRVSTLDALNVVNQLAREQFNLTDVPWSRHDVNGDGRVSAVDALNVINRLGAAEQMQTVSLIPAEGSRTTGESEQSMVLDPESSVDSTTIGKQASFDSLGTTQAVDSVFGNAGDDDFRPSEASSVDDWIALLQE